MQGRWPAHQDKLGVQCHAKGHLNMRTRGGRDRTLWLMDDLLYLLSLSRTTIQ